MAFCPLAGMARRPSTRLPKENCKVWKSHAVKRKRRVHELGAPSVRFVLSRYPLSGCARLSAVLHLWAMPIGRAAGRRSASGLRTASVACEHAEDNPLGKTCLTNFVHRLIAQVQRPVERLVKRLAGCVLEAGRMISRRQNLKGSQCKWAVACLMRPPVSDGIGFAHAKFLK